MQITYFLKFRGKFLEIIFYRLRKIKSVLILFWTTVRLFVVAHLTKFQVNFKTKQAKLWFCLIRIFRLKPLKILVRFVIRIHHLKSLRNSRYNPLNHENCRTVFLFGTVSTRVASHAGYIENIFFAPKRLALLNFWNA